MVWFVIVHSSEPERLPMVKLPQASPLMVIVLGSVLCGLVSLSLSLSLSRSLSLSC